MSAWSNYQKARKRFEQETSDEFLARDVSFGENARHACGDYLYWAAECESEAQIGTNELHTVVTKVAEFLRRR